ncbi:hypothetical protein [Robbsia andropogonis]|uniref:hypothetical protein n=1 Tax=Robbsia andropogonis TaxID=28092 RepID=UPI00209ECB5F|nr:hypothetical protein [Robbsia andropogonis]MCP1120119.1 hypothetical protein [Robbsia andropogonis]MCP1130049.1 hypothetical protein [Robbsia andropogonis]
MLDADGDYVMGGGQANFLIDSPDAVAQLIQTRFGLIQGEWFLDTSDGVPYDDIVGHGTESTRDLTVQQVILETTGVTQILSYASSVDPSTRKFTVAATIDTNYGSTSVTGSF